MNLMWHDMDYYYTVITNMFLIKTNSIVLCTLKHRKPLHIQKENTKQIFPLMNDKYNAAAGLLEHMQ